MVIDIICLILLVLAVFKGLKQGLIVALFSFASFIIGLAAAMKLSATVAEYLRTHMHVEGYWLPILSFMLVFAGVVLVIRWAGALLKKSVRVIFLGWVDALAGIVLYAFIYLVIYSVVLFFAVQIHLVSTETTHDSKTYSFIQPLGPAVMNGLGVIIPFFKNMFSDLQHFFGGIAVKHG